jgi:hypothetical protein
LVFPVPGGTSEIGRSGVVGGREDTSSIDEVVSLEASQTVTVGGMRSTVVRDSDTGTLSILDPVI